jgi:hypothetical protein
MGLLPAALALLIAGACDAISPDAHVQLRDSAGVRIVESRRAAWDDGEGWELSPFASLELAATGSGEPHRFSLVTGTVRLGDGRIVVMDGGAREVRFYDHRGAFLRSWPAPGEALPPGELTSLDLLAGDSLLVLDAASPALFVLSPEGALARRISLEAAGALPLARADALEDGNVLVRSGWSPALVQDVPSGLIRPPLRFLVFDPRGALLDTALVAPGDARLLIRLGPAGAFVPPLLGAVTVSDVHTGRLYLGTGESFEIRVHDPRGGLEAVVRLPGADLAVTPEELAVARSGWAAMERGNPVAGRLLAQIERTVPPPGKRPAFASLLVDRGGNLWVGAYPWGGPGSGPSRPTLFTVFDAAGRLLGEVEVPQGFEPRDIGNDWMLGIQRAGGGETVRMHRIER